MFRLAITCLLLCSGIVHADTIYKYVDKNGHVTFTNIPMRGAKAILRTPSSMDSSDSQPAPPQGRADRPASSNASPGSQIDSGTQRNRDDNRRRILQSELDNEKKALAQVQQELDEYRKKPGANLAQIQKLQDAVTDRERNITALNQELGKAAAGK